MDQISTDYEALETDCPPDHDEGQPARHVNKDPEDEQALEQRMDSPAALSCLQNGYNSTVVKYAIRTLLREGVTSVDGMKIARVCESMISTNTSSPVARPDEAKELDAGFGEPACDTKRDQARANRVTVTQSTGMDYEQACGGYDKEIYPTEENIKENLREDKLLPKLKTCKVCLENGITTYIPCGHLVPKKQGATFGRQPGSARERRAKACDGNQHNSNT